MTTMNTKNVLLNFNYLVIQIIVYTAQNVVPRWYSNDP